MQLEIGNNASDAAKTFSIVAGIVGVILGIAFFIYDYHVKSTQAISQAKTCEEMVILDGTDVANRLILCKLQVTQATAGK